MNEGLVTRLPVSIQNNDLPILGGLSFVASTNFEPVDGRKMRIKTADNPIVLNCEDSDVILTVGQDTAQMPYTIPAGQAETFYFSSNTKEECTVLIKSIYDISEIAFKHSKDIDNTFEEMSIRFNKVDKLEFYFSEVEGSLLAIAPMVLSRFTMDRPTALIKDGNIRAFINKMAEYRIANSNFDPIEMAANKGTSNYISNIPECLNGTYFGLYSTIYFTSDTETYPNGWYGYRIVNGKWYNSLDQIIAAPAGV